MNFHRDLGQFISTHAAEYLVKCLFHFSQVVRSENKVVSFDYLVQALAH